MYNCTVKAVSLFKHLTQNHGVYFSLLLLVLLVEVHSFGCSDIVYRQCRFYWLRLQISYLKKCVLIGF